MTAVALALRLQPFWNSGSNTFLTLAEGALVSLIGLLGIWQFSFSKAERAHYTDKIFRKLGRKKNGESA